MADELPKPASRKELYLAKAAGMDVDELPKPASRIEEYLNAIAEGGGGGGGYVLPTASADTLGGVKVGTGLAIDADTGVLSTSGGSGPTVVQTTGTSTTDVMSQNAISSKIWADPTTTFKVWLSTDNRQNQAGDSCICIGRDAYCNCTWGISMGRAAWCGNGYNHIAIGYDAQNNNSNSGKEGVILIGASARTSGSANISGSIALGGYSGGNITARGIMDIGSSVTTYGYDSTNYRLLTGVHDGVGAHDAVTLGQISALITAINSACGTSIMLASDGSITNANSGNNSGNVADPGDNGGGVSDEPAPEDEPGPE